MTKLYCEHHLLLGLSAHVVGGGKEGTSAEREQLCRDLTDHPLDMLARYTYSMSPVSPGVRVALSETVTSSVQYRSRGGFLAGGPSKTWVLSNYLVTVTTTERSGAPGQVLGVWLNSGPAVAQGPMSPVTEDRLYNTLQHGSKIFPAAVGVGGGLRPGAASQW